jgi:hypothetical protein
MPDSSSFNLRQGTQTNTHEMIMRHQNKLLKVPKQNFDQIRAKPFSFLSGVGGKETSQSKVTLKTVPGSGLKYVQHNLTPHDPNLNQKKGVKEPELTIFTDMNVDHHDFEI